MSRISAARTGLLGEVSRRDCWVRSPDRTLRASRHLTDLCCTHWACPLASFAPLREHHSLHSKTPRTQSAQTTTFLASNAPLCEDDFPHFITMGRRTQATALSIMSASSARAVSQSSGSVDQLISVRTQVGSPGSSTPYSHRIVGIILATI